MDINARINKVGWLFWASRLFQTVFQSISGRPSKEREKVWREKEKRNDR